MRSARTEDGTGRNNSRRGHPGPIVPGESSFVRRSSGVLLHVTSLPGPHGSGDLGPEAHQFVDFLAAAGQSWWQMLPVGPPGRAPSFSPYDGASALAGSPWLISLQALVDKGLLASRELRPARNLDRRQVQFHATQQFREARLRRAFAAFSIRSRRAPRRDYEQFREANADWLPDFALFMALRHASGGRPWFEWESGVRRRDPSALRAAREKLAAEVAGHCFLQFEFDRQWRALRRRASQRGVGLIGDLPIFVAHDSADVWSHPKLFQLAATGRPRRVSGYPPDRFNRDGQWWGHPQYHWPAHERSGFSWWTRRFERMFELFDALRIDHFLGFTRTWSIPATVHGARQGRWVPSPGAALFAAVEKKLGRRRLIAEDLGHVTAADLQLRDHFGLVAMRLFQFGFGSEPDSAEHLPHNYAAATAAYTGNHDNNTTVGWFRKLNRFQQRQVLRYAGGSAATIHLDAMRSVQSSPARVVIFPLQDVLGLDQRGRTNVPGTALGNWGWRCPRIPLPSTARCLRDLTQQFDRSPRSRKTPNERDHAP